MTDKKGMYKKKRDNDILKHVEENGGFITIEQCALMFFNEKKFAYDQASRRLKKLHESGYLQLHVGENGKYIYYKDKKPSQHWIYLMDFYAKLISKGAEIISYKHELKFKSTGKPCDGYFEYITENNAEAIIVEVDFTHNTDIKRKYEKLYHTRELQDKYKNEIGDEEYFPIVCIISASDKPKEQDKKYPFRLVRFNYNLDNFEKKIPIT